MKRTFDELLNDSKAAETVPKERAALLQVCLNAKERGYSGGYRELELVTVLKLMDLRPRMAPGLSSEVLVFDVQNTSAAELREAVHELLDTFGTHIIGYKTKPTFVFRYDKDAALQEITDISTRGFRMLFPHYAKLVREGNPITPGKGWTVEPVGMNAIDAHLFKEFARKVRIWDIYLSGDDTEPMDSEEAAEAATFGVMLTLFGETNFSVPRVRNELCCALAQLAHAVTPSSIWTGLPMRDIHGKPPK